MAAGIPARLTPGEGRRFGFTLAGAFAMLAAAAWWRDHGTAASVLAGGAGALAVAGIAIPTYLGPFERAWMGVAHAISRITTPIVMATLYLGLLLPVGVIRRALGGNPLVHPERDGSFWRERPESARRTRSMRRQF